MSKTCAQEIYATLRRIRHLTQERKERLEGTSNVKQSTRHPMIRCLDGIMAVAIRVHECTQSLVVPCS
jgi:hypothetical protein